MSNWTLLTPLNRGGGRGSKYRPYYTIPAVVIASSGDVLFTPETYNQLGRPKFIEVLEDVRARQLAFRPSSEDSITAYKVAPNSSDKKLAPGPTTMWKACAGGLMRARGLTIAKHSAVYHGEFNGDGLFVISLAQRPEVV